MKSWLLQEFASSTFTRCPHHTLHCMAGSPVEIHLSDGATPNGMHTPALIPVHRQERVHHDLLRDEAIGVIERVPHGEAVTRCHRMVVNRKQNSSPWRTVDLSPLNKHCARETLSTESPFHLARRVPGESRKTVTGDWNGYHYVPLRDYDMHLTKFMTPFGRRRYTRAPQGFISSGDGTTTVLMRLLSTSSARSDASMTPFTGMLSSWIIGGGPLITHSRRQSRGSPQPGQIPVRTTYRRLRRIPHIQCWDWATPEISGRYPGFRDIDIYNRRPFLVRFG